MGKSFLVKTSLGKALNQMANCPCASPLFAQLFSEDRQFIGHFGIL